MRRRTFLTAFITTIAAAASGAALSVRATVVDFCSKLGPGRRGIVLPPLPKWNKRTDDIDSADFARCALDYERALLPENVVFPRVGQIWVAVGDCEVNVQTWRQFPATQAWAPLWAGPFGKGFPVLMGDGKLRLQRGEEVQIQALDDPTKPLWVTVVPLRYEALHELVVADPQLRTQSRYVLMIRSAYTPCCAREENGFFHELFRLSEDANET
jgi:hypothetical protein